MAMSIGDLEENLSAELSWRKKEIIGLKTSAKISESAQPVICRAGSVVLCAHWEGFLRSSIQIYIDFVFSQKKILRLLSEEFFSISFFKDIKSASEADYPGSELHGIKFCRRLMLGIDIVPPNPKWKVTTDGNPSSAVTIRLLKTAGLSTHLGLSEAEWSTTKNFIDEQLLAERHKIAHGESLPIDISSFLAKADRVISICEKLGGLIIDAASSQRYLKDSN